MKNLLLNPLFLVGCAIRLVLIAAFLPSAPVEWYVPFLNASIAHLSLDPWGTWLAQGGAPAAFPTAS